MSKVFNQFLVWISFYKTVQMAPALVEVALSSCSTTLISVMYDFLHYAQIMHKQMQMLSYTHTQKLPKNKGACDFHS